MSAGHVAPGAPTRLQGRDDDPRYVAHVHDRDGAARPGPDPADAVAQPLGGLSEPRIARAVDAGRVDRDDRRPRRLERARDVLALGLGAAVGGRQAPDRVIDGDRRPAQREEGGDARHVKDGVEAELVRDAEDIARAVDVGGQDATVSVHLGSRVERRVAAAERLGDGGGVRYVARHHLRDFDAEGREHSLHLLRAAREQAHRVTGSEQRFDCMGADEARSSGDHHLHFHPPVTTRLSRDPRPRSSAPPPIAIGRGRTQHYIESRPASQRRKSARRPC